MRFKKKPVVIDAIQWMGDNIDELWDTFGAEKIYGPTENNVDTLIIDTIEGKMRAPKGWWIIKGIKGELYPCAPDIFASSYEPADQYKCRICGSVLNNSDLAELHAKYGEHIPLDAFSHSWCGSIAKAVQQ